MVRMHIKMRIFQIFRYEKLKYVKVSLKDSVTNVCTMGFAAGFRFAAIVFLTVIADWSMRIVSKTREFVQFLPSHFVLVNSVSAI